MRRITLLHYVDKRFTLVEEEIDRRVRAHEAKTDAQIADAQRRTELAAEHGGATSEALDQRLTKVEAIIERQRGRQAAYAALAAVAGVIVTLLILAAGHVHIL